MQLKQSSKYFSQLNYTLANEDTYLELALAKKTAAKNILTVCGSGGRSLPFLSLKPQHLTLVDISEVQIALAQLKEATLRELTFDQYCLFWGFPPFDPKENCEYRCKLFDQLTSLNAKAQSLFRVIFAENNYMGLIYHGRWERQITGIPAVIRKIFGDKIMHNYDRIFEFRDLTSQKAYADKVLHSWLWKALPRGVFFTVGNAKFFNTFLYKGDFVKKNIPESYFDHYRMAYRNMITHSLARENYFLQLCILGKIAYPEANPPEAQQDIFNAGKASLGQTKLTYCLGDIIDPVASYETSDQDHPKYDFVSLSDVPSYFHGAREIDYLQALKKHLTAGAFIVTRCYLRIPENTDLQEFVDVSQDFADEINHERVQMYKIYVYKHVPNSTPNSTPKSARKSIQKSK